MSALAAGRYDPCPQTLRGHPYRENAMTELVNYQLDDNIATITFHNGKVNAMSPEHMRDINAALDQAEAAGAVVMLVGQPGIFSAGFDLKVFQRDPVEGVEMVTMGSRLCRRLQSFPTPVVGVCTGHAIAQGCFLLLSCDYRIGTEGPFQLGLNEVQIGMTMHHAGIEMARFRLTPAYFQRSVINAEMYDPAAAMAAGFLDKVVPADQLLAVATAEARRLAGLNKTAHHGSKLKARAEQLEILDRAIARDYEEQMAIVGG